MKRQPPEWKKALANDMIDKGLVSEIHKQLIQPNVKKQNKQKQRDHRLGQSEAWGY